MARNLPVPGMEPVGETLSDLPKNAVNGAHCTALRRHAIGPAENRLQHKRCAVRMPPPEMACAMPAEYRTPARAIGGGIKKHRGNEMSPTRPVKLGLCFEDVHLGMEETYSRTVTAEDIDMFAAVSGDTNPVHLDEAFASSTAFGGRIAHGLLVASYFSTILGTKLPGPGSIYVSQTLTFRAPVHIGDTVVARVRVTYMNDEKFRVTLACESTVNGEPVLDGEAVVRIPSRAERAAKGA
jgi:3-hydroxybutyryl-CoA dehydratase